MLRSILAVSLLIAVAGLAPNPSGTTAAQKPETKPPSAVPAPKTESAQKTSPPPAARPAQPPKNVPDPEIELQRAIENAGGDRAALVRTLEDYLRRFPDSPRKVQVYRALVESAMQLRDSQRALDYAERIIAVNPDDAAMMLFAAEMLERAGDDRSLTRAVGYATRVLDRLEKSPAEGKPPRVSQAEWESQQKKILMSVYLIRGRLQMTRRSYDTAVADLEASYRIMPNAPSSMRLGEIAELRKDHPHAIQHYITAFVLSDPSGLQVDRSDLRRKLGNVWQLLHGSEAGLGEELLKAYDRLAADSKVADTGPRNKDATDPFAFVLRRPDGGPPVKLSESKGRVVVLNFWATWCLPCRELEPLFERVTLQFQAQKEVVFLSVNGDEDEERVKPYIEREKMRSAAVFSDGLDRALAVRAFPTVIVLDRAGKIIYRVEGFAPEGFVEGLAGAIERGLTAAN